MIPRLLLCALLLAATVPAQRPAPRKKTAPKPATVKPAPDRWTLASVLVSGNKIFPSEAIVAASGLQPGATVQVPDLRRATDLLTDAGAFETLSYRYATKDDRLTVTFEVQEVPDLYPVGFQRLEVPDAELLRLLQEKVPLFGPHVPATGAMVKRIAGALQARLGFTIIGRLVSDPRRGALVMSFRPADAPPVVSFVKFEGSSVLRDVDLQKAFFQIAVGVPYTEDRLRELLDSTIRPLFEEKGRLKVSFGPLRTEPAKEIDGLIVTVPVEDGEEFLFGVVRFDGHEQLSAIELARMARIEEAEVANFALVNKALAAIDFRYRREGYLHAKAAFERTLIEKTHSVDLLIKIQEGSRYLFRRLEIKGLDINSAAAVRKRWALERGKPYDASYPDTFLKHIEQEAMFDRLAKTASRITIDEEAKMVDVEIEFKGEAPKPRRPVPD